MNKDKSVIWPLLNGIEVLSSASDETKLFAEIFAENCNPDNSGIFGYLLLTTLRCLLLNLSQLLLKKPKLLYTLQNFIFQIFWEILSVVPVLDNVDTFLATIYYPGHILSVVKKIFEKFVNNNLLECIESFGRFSDFFCVRLQIIL